MSELAYTLQLLVVAMLIGILVSKLSWLLVVQTLLWFLGCALIVHQYGVEGQLVLYSNDQQYYTQVLERILNSGLPIDIDWWLSASRFPITLPAAVIALVGIAPSLALKTVAVLYLLMTTALIGRVLPNANMRQGLVTVYLTGVGTAGVFFSLLAQRETSMMFFSTLTFFTKSLPVRLLSLTMLLVLRPHLAVAIALALIIIEFSNRNSHTHDWSPIRGLLTIITGTLIGYYVYILGLWFQSGIANAPGHTWGILPVLRVASNYFGLQFLTANPETVESSLGTLVVGRLIFSETLMIPLVFTTLVLTSRRFDREARWALLAFAIYVGLVTNTDFNSFRQNIPLIPVLGVIVVQYFQSLKTQQNTENSMGALKVSGRP